MTQYEARLELKSKLQRELLSFVELEDVQQNYFDHEGDTREEFWHDQREDWINELNDRRANTLEVVGYAHGLQLANALGFYDWSEIEDEFSIKITNGESLGYFASLKYVDELGLVSDVVDAYLLDEFNVDLDNNQYK